MTASPKKRYEHFDTPIEDSEPAISGIGMDAQRVLSGTVNKWVRLTQLPNEANTDYKARLQENAQKMVQYRSHLLVADSHDSSGSRLVAIASSTPRIGYSWMPVLGEKPIAFEYAKAFAIWLNSTLGRISLRSVTARKISYPKFRPVSFDAIPFPDIDNDDIVSHLGLCYDTTCDDDVSQFREGRVAIRELWDDAVATALEIDRDLIAECADILARDSFVSKDRFFETEESEI